MSDSFFFNLSEEHLAFSDVVMRMKDFIQKDPRSVYVLSIGTDSQVNQNITRFMTAIHLHRIGKGAWGCLTQQVLNRPVQSIREKISLETAFSQKVCADILEGPLTELMDLLLPFAEEGADLRFEVHLDIGKKGSTKELIQEMTGMITAMGIEAKIKPDSYAAFCYANRYTK
ncbi:ribonuclease H-like YkuK family protein [Bacillus altitudinis]|uniref:ribonuclease H-like YkuK family protein n=1 Tax=Bacillus altitudinis TaxID=293387 RepID=UPI001C3EB0C3|nr:ribonuclease H-like YkuK family protein [Bacillus altitudinis]MCY7454703.1 ribonuclease H-like YkuK family protein [Bacillus altitudinis]QXJ47469.1 ribonuclease H-like YkuK family protein [Bacillus altitudinis]